MTWCLHRQTRGSGCQVAPVVQVPAEPQITGVSVPALLRTEHIKLLFHSQDESMAIGSMDHSASADRSSSLLAHLAEEGSNIQKSQEVWELLLGAGGSPSVELPPGPSSTGTAMACSSSQKTEPCPKSSFLLRNSFFKAVLAPVFHSCLFYARSRSTSVFSLLKQLFRSF